MEEKNKNKRERRDLTPDEQKALFALYCKHQGNSSAVERDPDGKYHRNIIREYVIRYGFEKKRLEKVAKEAEMCRKNWQNRLMKGKNKAILKAIDLLEPERIEKVNKDGSIATFIKQPDSKSVKTAYEIIKTELGEPTNISKNTNIDESPEVKETIDGIRELIKQGQKDELQNNAKTIQSGGQTINNTPEIQTTI